MSPTTSNVLNKSDTRELLRRMVKTRTERSPRERIVRGITSLIREKRLPHKSPLPSSNELAEIFGVSFSTLQAAMNDLAGKKLVNRRPKVGTFVNLPETAGDDETKILKNVCIISDIDESSPFLRRYMGAFLRSAHRRDCEVILDPLSVLKGKLPPEKVKRWGEMLAVVLVSPSTTALERIEELVQEGLRVVLVNAHHDNPHIGCVYSDHFSGCYQATKRLIELGHKRICFTSPAPIEVHASYGDRLNGCKRAMTEAGLGEPIVIDNMTLDIVRRVFLDNEGSNATAVLDIGCKKLLFDMLKLFDIKIPEEVSVISYDQFRMTTDDGKTIATVEQPIEQIVETAFSLIPNLGDGGFMLRLSQVFYEGGTIGVNPKQSDALESAR